MHDNLTLSDDFFDPGFDRRYAAARAHIDATHGWTSDAIKDPIKKKAGYIVFAVKRTENELDANEAIGDVSPWTEHYYTYDNLLEDLGWLLHVYKDRDCYITGNTVYKKRRTTANLRQLRSLWVDLDCYKIGIKAGDLLEKLKREVFGHVLPMPNRIVFSGGEDGGLWLFWNIEPVPYKNKKDENGEEKKRPYLRWKALQRQFSYLLREYGADMQTTDGVRVHRLSGTTNTKTGEMAECIVLNKQRYDLADLAQTYLPVFEAPASPDKKRERKATVHVLQTAANYFWRLKQDLLTLCRLRNFQMTGQKEQVGREYTLFLVRHFAQAHGADRESALQEALELNAKFTEPLPEREVVRDTKSRWEPYRYKRQTLIELYGITEEEQNHMLELAGPSVRLVRRRNGWREQQARRREEAGVIPRAERRAADVRKLAEVLGEDSSGSLSYLARSTGFSKSKCARLREDAMTLVEERKQASCEQEQKVFQKPHPIIENLQGSFGFEEDGVSDLCSDLGLPALFVKNRVDPVIMSMTGLGEVACAQEAVTVESEGEELWVRCLELLYQSISGRGMQISFFTWLVNSSADRLEGGVLHVRLQNEFACAYVCKQFGIEIESVRRTVGLDKIEFKT